MADGYTRYRTRRALVNEVLDHVDRTGDPALPWAQVSGLAAEFNQPRDLLLALQHRWTTQFTARLDALLESPPGDWETAVQRLWNELAAEMPVLRRILDEHPDEVDVIAGSPPHGRGPIARMAVQGVR